MHFKETYEEARESFRHLTQGLGELRSHAVPSKKESDLTIETLYIPPASGLKERLLILTSGIHGIEGFTGSALQSYFLEKKFFGLKDENLGILIIHGINPYGFKTKRRVTESNVDLNRNFDTSKELFKTQNPGYTDVRSLLESKTKFSRLGFYLSALLSLKKYGRESLRRAIVKGQYQYPEGIFFGGSDFEPQVKMIQTMIDETGVSYKQALLVDLHTGYGEKGKLHLFGDRSPYLNQNHMNDCFKGLAVDYGQNEDFYEVTGGFTIFLAKLFHQKSKFAGVCFEFGTINSHKTLGSLDSLYRMVSEGHNREEFIHMFYPQSAEWRKSAVEQFEQALTLCLKNQKLCAN